MVIGNVCIGGCTYDLMAAAALLISIGVHVAVRMAHKRKMRELKDKYYGRVLQ